MKRLSWREHLSTLSLSTEMSEMILQGDKVTHETTGKISKACMKSFNAFICNVKFFKFETEYSMDIEKCK